MNGMKKLIFLLCSMSILSGCAQKIDENLSSFSGVTYTDYSNEYKYINTYTINGNTNRPMDDINVCTIQNIRDQDVVLSDNTNSFVGITGNYYNLTSTTKSYKNGRQYIGDNVIVIDGLTDYQNPQALIPIKNYVRYTLSIRKDDDNISYQFNNITQAQSTTGSIPNNGFNPVGNWDGANPSIILKALTAEAQKINNCLAN